MIMFNKRSSLFATAAVFALTACGGDDGDKKGFVEEAKDSISNAAKNKDLPGTAWASNCASIDLGFDLGVAAKQTWTFDATSNNVTRSFIVYGEQDCVNALGELEILGSYLLKDSDKNDENPVDLQFNKVFITSQSDSLTESLGNVSWCGVSDWTKDQKIEITETVGQGLCQPPVSLDKTNFDRVLVDGERMYMGSPFTMAPLAEADRPEAVNMDIEFQKRGR